VLSTTDSTAASDHFYFVWDSSKGKLTGSDHQLLYGHQHNLICVLRRPNLGWPPAPHWATIHWGGEKKGCVVGKAPAGAAEEKETKYDNFD
jgi:hypothetical protein